MQSTQRFAFVWLALELGAKSNISGFILFVMGVPALLISLPVGVMSDHMNRRTLLLTSQVGALIITTLIAITVTTGHMTISWAIVGSFVAGIFIALGSPVRSAIIPTLVPSDKLVGAIAVSTIGNNIGLIIGPATAGPAIALWGIEGAFWLQAVLYLIGFFVLLPFNYQQAITPRGDVYERRFSVDFGSFTRMPQFVLFCSARWFSSIHDGSMDCAGSADCQRTSWSYR